MKPHAIVLAAASTLLAPGSAGAEPAGNPPAVNVPNVILIDAATRTVLFERGADDVVTPASTAKLMTSEYVMSLLKSGTLRRDQTFSVSMKAWREGGAPSRGSTMFAKVHSAIPVDDLLHGLIIDSANDAAITLAEGIAGSEDAFARKLTERARELGLTHLAFANAWGNADPGETVTPRDMALLAGHIIETYPDFYRIYGQRDFLWNKIKQPNRNPLLAMDIGADGLKTGNIDDSGYAIIGSAVQNGQRLILALYGAKSAGERNEEARKLLQWGFRFFEQRRIFAAGDVVGTAQVYGGAARDVALMTPTDVTVLVPREGGERLSAKISYTGPLMAPVAADRPVAQLQLFRGDKAVLSTPLRTAATVPVGSLTRRAFDAGLEFVGGLFRRYVLRS